MAKMIKGSSDKNLSVMVCTKSSTWLCLAPPFALI